MWVISWIMLALCVSYFASTLGRSKIFWFFLALLLSPLVAGIVLLIGGKSKKLRALDIEKKEKIDALNTLKSEKEAEIERLDRAITEEIERREKEKK